MMDKYFKTNIGITAFVLAMFPLLCNCQSDGFDFSSPSKTITLVEELREISGITRSEKPGNVYVVQDEIGKIYELELATGKVLNTKLFESSGDFEDLCLIYPKMYIVRSKGDLYELDLTENSPAKIYRTFLNKDFDVEGLCVSGNKLLVACKGFPNPQSGDPLKRSVYSFDLTSQSLDVRPVFEITKEALITHLRKSGDSPDILKKLEEKPLEMGIGLSALAVDPISKDYYLISSVGKLLMVLNKNGQITKVKRLPKSDLPQPEGLYFDEKGNLYISSEGKNGPAVIQAYYRN